MSESNIEARLDNLESREAIRDLVAKYCYVIDNRDIPGIGALMAPDARFRSKDGVMSACGRQAIVDQFRGRFSVLGMSNHFTHGHFITFHGPDRATGVVSSHAELVRNGRPMLTALRYEDEYVRRDGQWFFADRLLTFCYYLDVEDYARFLGDRLRMRAYDKPQAADWPEGTESWKDYEMALDAGHKGK